MSRKKTRGVTKEENAAALGYDLDEFIVKYVQQEQEDEAKRQANVSLAYMLDENDISAHCTQRDSDNREAAVLRAIALRRRYVAQTPSYVLHTQHMSLEDLEHLSLFDTDSRHVCSIHTCTDILHFKKAEAYADLHRQGVMHKASGNVYVCTDTGQSHICGASRCKRGEAMPKSEGVSCPISGLVVGHVVRSAEYTPYGATRAIPAKPGRDEGNSKRIAADDKHYLEDMEEQRALKDLEENGAYAHLDAGRMSENTTWDFDRSIGGYSLVSEEEVGGGRCASVMRTTEDGSIYRADDDDDDDNNIIEYFIPRIKKRGGGGGIGKRRRISGTTNETRLSKRRKVTNVKGSIFDQKRREKYNMRTYTEIKQIVSDFLCTDRMDMLKSKIIPREKEVYQKLVKSSKYKRERNELLTIKDVIDAHLCHALATYRKMLPTAVTQNPSSDMIDYYANCLFHLWVIMNESDYAQNISNNVNFVECIVALLYMLKTGFVVPVMIDGESNVRVKTLNATTEEESSAASGSAVNGYMEFISPHPQLLHYLPQQNDIRKIKMTKFRQHSTRTETQYYTNVSPMKGQKEIHKCYLNLFLRKRCGDVQKLEALEKFTLYSRVDIRNYE